MDELFVHLIILKPLEDIHHLLQRFAPRLIKPLIRSSVLLDVQAVTVEQIRRFKQQGLVIHDLQLLVWMIGKYLRKCRFYISSNLENRIAVETAGADLIQREVEQIL